MQDSSLIIRLQQHLPFTVLKQILLVIASLDDLIVATAPTVYGIETDLHCFYCLRFSSLVATAPTVYGIETQ